MEGWYGLMFLDHKYPDEGEWEIDEDYAEDLAREARERGSR